MNKIEKLPFLLVGTAGVEISAFAPTDPYARELVHYAQSWSPIGCHCGEIHSPCAPAMVVILVGRPEAHVHLDPQACGLAISPDGSPWNVPGVCDVSDSALDFNPWAADVVRHVLGGPTEPGVVGFDLLDVVTVLRPARPVKFACATSEKGLVDAAAKLASAPWSNENTRALTLCLRGPPRTTLAEINDATSLLAHWFADADIFLCALTGLGQPQVSILGS